MCAHTIVIIIIIIIIMETHCIVITDVCLSVSNVV